MFDGLVGENIRIIPMGRQHVGELFEISRDPIIWTHLPKTIETYNDMIIFVEDALAKKELGTEFPFVVIHRDSNRIIGTTRFLDISHVNKNLEIGWTWYEPNVWGTNINTQCKYLLLKYCFESLKFIRVQLKTDERNIRSQKAIEKIGGVREGILRNQMIRRDGTYRNSIVYSVIESEWEFVKKNLENLLLSEQGENR